MTPPDSSQVPPNGTPWKYITFIQEQIQPNEHTTVHHLSSSKRPRTIEYLPEPKKKKNLEKKTQRISH